MLVQPGRHQPDISQDTVVPVNGCIEVEEQCAAASVGAVNADGRGNLGQGSGQLALEALRVAAASVTGQTDAAGAGQAGC